ncbi:MAG: NAD(P)H-binding protein [Thermoprotei archaeon]
MGKTVAVMGSTGFVGYNTVRGLVSAGLEVRALLRKGSASKRALEVSKLGVETFEVDYMETNTLVEALKGCDTVYNFIGVSFQSAAVNVYEANTRTTLNTVRAAKRAGIQGYVYNSGLGVNTHTTQSYFLSKLHAERIIRKSGLKYIIFRPSYIIGLGDEFSDYLLKNILKGEPIPVYGSGLYRLQPIFVDDAVGIYVACATSGNNWMKTYDLVGMEVVRFIDYVRLLAKALNKEARLVHVDLERAYRDAMRQRSKRKYNPYLSVDELDVLISDFVSSPAKIKEAFGINLTPLKLVLQKIAQGHT